MNNKNIFVELNGIKIVVPNIQFLGDIKQSVQIYSEKGKDYNLRKWTFKINDRDFLFESKEEATNALEMLVIALNSCWHKSI